MKKTQYVPLATTEGALVASVNRGCKAIEESGGAVIYRENVGVTRGPVFETNGLSDSMELASWITNHRDALNDVAATTSSHIRLADVSMLPIGHRVYVRFSYNTQDAMGMNMATIATTAITRFVEKQTAARCVAVAGNFDTDKKPSWLNILMGRGRKVRAEVVLSKKTLSSVLKTTARDVFDVWLAKNMMGSALSGSIGFNAHAANAIAALFAATGQDLAHVGEVSSCVVSAHCVDDDLSISVYLPDVIVGSVGGGTMLPTQKEALSIMGIAGGNGGKNADTLAGVVGGVVLAGEISLLSSLAEGTLSKSHERLARGKNV